MATRSTAQMEEYSQGIVGKLHRKFNVDRGGSGITLKEKSPAGAAAVLTQDYDGAFRKYTTTSKSTQYHQILQHFLCHCCLTSVPDCDLSARSSQPAVLHRANSKLG